MLVAAIVVGQLLWCLFIVCLPELGAAVPTSVPSPSQAATLPLEVPLGVHDLPRAPRARPRNPIMERHYEMTRLVFIPHLPGPVRTQPSRYRYLTGAYALDWDDQPCRFDSFEERTDYRP